MTKNRALILPAVLVGIALLVVAVIYLVEPAKSLPSFFPGHAAGSTHHHVKHALAAFVVGTGRVRVRLVPDGADARANADPAA